MKNKEKEEESRESPAALMGDLERLADGVRKRLYERAASPFLSSFAISWTFVNFRVVYALITSDSYEAAFALIDQKIWPNWYDPVLIGLALPSALAFSYLLIIPYVEEQAVKLWIQGKIRVRNKRAALERGAPIEDASIASYEEQIADLQRINDEEKSILVQQHTRLAQELKTRLGATRDRLRESVIHPRDVDRVLNNLHQNGRDVILLAWGLPSSERQYVSSLQVVGVLKEIYGEAIEADVVATIRSLSEECYTEKDYGGEVTDVSFQLSKRGRALAEHMRNSSMTPKSMKLAELDRLIVGHQR